MQNRLFPIDQELTQETDLEQLIGILEKKLKNKTKSTSFFCKTLAISLAIFSIGLFIYQMQKYKPQIEILEDYRKKADELNAQVNQLMQIKDPATALSCIEELGNDTKSSGFTMTLLYDSWCNIYHNYPKTLSQFCLNLIQYPCRDIVNLATTYEDVHPYRNFFIGASGFFGAMFFLIYNSLEGSQKTIQTVLSQHEQNRLNDITQNLKIRNPSADENLLNYINELRLIKNQQESASLLV